VRQVGISEAAQHTAESFYVYFGGITHIAEVTRTGTTEKDLD
jgi:hypothetical protein